MTQQIATAATRAVPLAIIELHRRGGPTPDDWSWLLSGGLVERLATEGDLLLGGQHSPLMGEIVRAIAILAFLPGGITIFGEHFDVRSPSPAWLALHLQEEQP